MAPLARRITTVPGGGGGGGAPARIDGEGGHPRDAVGGTSDRQPISDVPAADPDQAELEPGAAAAPARRHHEHLPVDEHLSGLPARQRHQAPHRRVVERQEVARGVAAQRREDAHRARVTMDLPVVRDGHLAPGHQRPPPVARSPRRSSRPRGRH
jgi:hypothetical protein